MSKTYIETMKTPEQIAEQVADAAVIDWDEAYDVALAAIEADRAQRTLKPYQVRLTVDLDRPAWEGASPAVRAAWIDDLIDAANAEGYVSCVQVGA